MGNSIRFLSVSVSFAVSAALQANAGGEKAELTAIAKSRNIVAESRTINEYLGRISPYLSGHDVSFLRAKVEGRTDRRMPKIEAQGVRKFAFSINRKLISFEIVSVSKRTYLLNNKLLVLDRDDISSAWEKVHAALPRETSHAGLRLLLPHAEAAGGDEENFADLVPDALSLTVMGMDAVADMSLGCENLRSIVLSACRETRVSLAQIEDGARIDVAPGKGALRGDIDVQKLNPSRQADYDKNVTAIESFVASEQFAKLKCTSDIKERASACNKEILAKAKELTTPAGGPRGVRSPAKPTGGVLQ